jgi:hypothetical protein
MNIERENLVLNPRELNLVIEALNEYYLRAIARATKSKGVRPRKVTEGLGFIQETLQSMVTHRNIRTGKLRAESTPTEATNSTGDPELAGDKGTNTPGT